MDLDVHGAPESSTDVCGACAQVAQTVGQHELTSLALHQALNLQHKKTPLDSHNYFILYHLSHFWWSWTAETSVDACRKGKMPYKLHTFNTLLLRVDKISAWTTENTQSACSNLLLLRKGAMFFSMILNHYISSVFKHCANKSHYPPGNHHASHF